MIKWYHRKNRKGKPKEQRLAMPPRGVFAWECVIMKATETETKKAISAYFDAFPTKGRPLKKLNDVGAALVYDLAGIMCTEEEIACVLGTTVEVLHNKVNLETFTEQMKNGKEKGKTSLRRYQFELAKRNPSMAIWLGKQYLGQKDDTDDDKKNGGVKVVIEGKIEDLSAGAPDD